MNNTSKLSDVRLKSVVPKAVWGCRTLPDKKSIITLSDYEYVVAVGSGIMVFDNSPHGTRKTYMVPHHHNDVVCVTQMALSFDSKYLITVVKLRNSDAHSVHFLIYTVEHLRVEYRSPRLITYKNPAYVVGGGRMEITCVVFSHDSQFIALGTNVPAVGVVIMDHKKGDVFQVIPTNSVPNHVTFNPLDPCKLCVTGGSGLFQFWRVTAKSIHLAPVVGLRGHGLNYTHHIWIAPYADGLVVASSSSGLLTIVLGGEQKGHNVHVFGQHAGNAASELRSDAHSVVHILSRGDVLLALSPYNEVVAFEVRRVSQSKGINTLSPTLNLLKRYRLVNIDELFGIDFCIRDSVTSFAVTGMSKQSVFQVEVIGDIDQEVSGGINTSGESAVKDAVAASAAAEWVNIHNEQLVFRFHGAEVHSLSLAARAGTLVTSSYGDATVRVWSTAHPSSFRGSWLVESFADRPQENPFHVDIHPSGLLTMCAVEGEVREYAITDDHLEMYRRINIKGPFTGPTGTAHMVTHPVSIVKYSNGGQYIVVVTGKLAQVFNLNVLEYGHSGGSGVPQRVMILSDHIAPITDVDFSRDDSRIITTSSDGCIYYWRVGALTRDQEYVFKGMSINKVALSKTKQKETHIVAICEAYGEHQSQHVGPAEAMLLRRQSTVLQRRSTRHGDSSDGFGAPVAGSGDRTDAHTAPSPIKHGQSTLTTAQASSQSLRRTYLAIWKDSLTSSAPRVLTMDCEVRSVALGETDGPDRFDICVLGMADGRVLVASLPLPSVTGRPHLEIHTSAVPAHISLPSPLAAGVHSASQAFQSQQTKVQSKRGKGAATTSATAESKRGLLAAPHEEHLGGDAGTVTTAQTSRTGDAESTATTMAPKDRDDMTIQSRQGSVLENTNAALGALNGGAGSDGSGGGGHQHAHSVPSGAAQSFRDAAGGTLEQQDRFDESRCRQMRMHFDAVTHVSVSRNGLWIFSAGADGVVHMFATSKRGAEMVEMAHSADSMESKFHMIEASKLRALRSQLHDTERMIETNKKDYDLKVDKILESKEKMVMDLKHKMTKEIKQRDEAILQSRNEYLKLKSGMNGEIATIRKQCNDTISELELNYEQKLAQESLYLDKMKQAYDEYVVHSRMDLAELQRRTEQRVEAIEGDRGAALLEAEKQKKTVLQYFEYVKLRNEEVVQSLVNSQVEERCKLKEDLAATVKQLEKAQAHLLTGEVQANREVSKLQLTIEEKETDVLKLRNALDWSQTRIVELEQALSKSTAELGVRTEMSEKWELKTGEMQQKIIELEKLRKALTTQLHTLRQELGPKEESLMRATEKLQETDREYELSLQAIADKEKLLSQKSENLNLLQKQVRDLRNATSRKEKVLRRAAILLDEYKYALEQAYFKAEKRTVNPREHGLSDGVLLSGLGAAAAAAALGGEVAGGKLRRGSDHKTGTGLTNGAAAGAGAAANQHEVVEIISQNEGMRSALKRLSDVLTPFLDEEKTDAEVLDEQEQVRLEQDRHMHLLHRSVTGLRANLDLAQTVAAAKVHNHLSDNQNLLKEVNNLRFEVRNLSMENQRLIAQLEFNSRMHSAKRNSHSSIADLPPGDSAAEPLFPQYHTQQRHGQVQLGPGHDSSLSASLESSFFGDPVGNTASSSMPKVEEGLSFDSNGLRNEAEFFNRMRTGVVAPPALAETAPLPGPRGFGKKVAKSASTPYFKVHGVRAEPAGDGGAAAMGRPQQSSQQPSVASKRTISGMPSYGSLDTPGGSGSLVSGGQQVVNKNEFARTADEKIAALIELNEQQIKSYKEELSKEQAPTGKALGKAGTCSSNASRSSTNGKGATSSSADYGVAVQFPSIQRGGAGAPTAVRKR